MTRPTYDECLVEAELRARASYAEPHRHYHSERHLEACLRQLEDIHNLDGRERQVLRWAILWHDAVYEAGLHDNEERSAPLAEEELLACGVAPADAAEVARLIRATAKHRTDGGDRLGALLISIDLSILGTDPDAYRQYVENVRKEYAHVPDPLWQTGRAAVLERLLNADPIFPNAEFRSRLERQARHNMKNELRSLLAS